MLVLFIIFLSDLLISSIIDNIRGLYQTLAGLGLLVSSLDFKFRPAIVPPCMPGWAAISERKPRAASILTLQYRVFQTPEDQFDPTSKFPYLYKVPLLNVTPINKMQNNQER